MIDQRFHWRFVADSTKKRPNGPQRKNGGKIVFKKTNKRTSHLFDSHLKMRPLSQFVTEPGVCVCVPLNEMEIVLFFFLVEAADVFDIFLGIPRALRVIRVEKIHLYINV